MSEYTSGVNGRAYEPNTLHVTGDFDDFCNGSPFLCPFYGHEALEMGVNAAGLREVTLDLTFAGGRELYDLNGVKRQVAYTYLFTFAPGATHLSGDETINEPLGPFADGSPVAAADCVVVDYSEGETKHYRYLTPDDLKPGGLEKLPAQCWGGCGPCKESPPPPPAPPSPPPPSLPPSPPPPPPSLSPSPPPSPSPSSLPSP